MNQPGPDPPAREEASSSSNQPGPPFLPELRIPRPRGASSSTHPGPPVLLAHGISLSSTCWVVNQPDESLAFILANKGTTVVPRVTARAGCCFLQR